MVGVLPPTSHSVASIPAPHKEPRSPGQLQWGTVVPQGGESSAAGESLTYGFWGHLGTRKASSY